MRTPRFCWRSAPPSQAEVDQAYQALLSAQAGLDAARASLNSAQAGIQSARVGVESAQYQLSLYNLTSPHLRRSGGGECHREQLCRLSTARLRHLQWQQQDRYLLRH